MLPNPEKKTSSYSAERSSGNNTKVINFTDFVGNMDGKDDGKIPNGIALYSKTYKGQKVEKELKRELMCIVIDLMEQNLIVNTGQKYIRELM